jgi:hypothetical protein
MPRTPCVLALLATPAGAVAGDRGSVVDALALVSILAGLALFVLAMRLRSPRPGPDGEGAPAHRSTLMAWLMGGLIGACAWLVHLAL